MAIGPLWGKIDIRETQTLQTVQQLRRGRQLKYIITPQQRTSLWSSGQSSWLQTQRSRVRFPALPDFLSGIESGTGWTEPREDI
jgi:hypothetical protein